MTDLAKLLDEARSADPGNRITFRDSIAAYGRNAVPTMTAWLADPRLGAFAVRVLQRIASEPEARADVVRALRSADSSRLAEVVARDIASALDQLQPSAGPTTRAKSTAAVTPWPGDRTVSALERAFHEAMLGIFTRAGEATRKQRSDGTFIRGYWASYFLRGVRNHGGVAYAHQLLQAAGTSDGFQRLADEHRLDLTVEALILRPAYAELFTDEERAVAASRLARAGYQPPRDV